MSLSLQGIIATLNAFSAHADYAETSEWLQRHVVRRRAAEETTERLRRQHDPLRAVAAEQRDDQREVLGE